jgi:hypothetical protein
MTPKIILSLVILVCSSIQGSHAIELVMIDTMLCSQKISNKQKETLQKLDAESCQESTVHASKRYHANQVLDVLFAHLPKEKKISIKHKNVFDPQGKHSSELWDKAIKELKSSPAQLVLLAVGSNKESLKKLKLPTKHFYLMASGQSNNQYSENAKLWPQSLLIQKEIKGILVGAYTGVEGKTTPELAPALAPKLLHQKSIDYLFPESSLKSGLSGSSHAVSIAATALIKRCMNHPIDLWRECLKKNQRELHLLRDLKGWTF